MSKSGILIQNIDLKFRELYYEVFWYEPVKFMIFRSCVWYLQLSKVRKVRKCDVKLTDKLR